MINVLKYAVEGALTFKSRGKAYLRDGVVCVGKQIDGVS